jgi:hypothetical protein
MRRHHRWLSIAFGIMFSFVIIGCGGGDTTTTDDPNVPAPDVVPEEDFEGEAAMDQEQQ